MVSNKNTKNNRTEHDLRYDVGRELMNNGYDHLMSYDEFDSLINDVVHIIKKHGKLLQYIEKNYPDAYTQYKNEYACEEWNKNGINKKYHGT